MSIQNKLDLLSEFENFKLPLITFGRDVSLKLVVDLGNKDKSGNKKRYYEEFRYSSNKYPNYDHLVSSVLKFTPYLCIEYPKQESDRVMNDVIYIRNYSIYGLVQNMIQFNNVILDAFAKDKKGEIRLLSDKVVKIVSYPAPNSSIEFSQDIYEDKNGGKDIGVRIGLNNNFWFTVRMSTLWMEFFTIMNNCDLYGWSLNLINIHAAALVGNAMSELGTGTYNSASRYTQYWDDDPDNIVNSENSVKINRRKILTNEERKKSFFDE